MCVYNTSTLCTLNGFKIRLATEIVVSEKIRLICFSVNLSNISKQYLTQCTLETQMYYNGSGLRLQK